jgi:Fur family ferric uptake transcriptional regulator
VIAQLSLESCAVSAEELESELNKRGRKVARASVYRALEALAEIDLVQRVDLGESGSRWERVGVSDDHHHHHLVCRQCGAIVPFESELLESALHSIGSEDGFSVDSHDVTLFGRCTSCTSGTGN